MSEMEISLPVSELLPSEAYKEHLPGRDIVLCERDGSNPAVFYGSIVFTNARIFLIFSGGEDFGALSDRKYLYTFFDDMTGIYTKFDRNIRIVQYWLVS